MKILITHMSYSGNTEEVADIIESTLEGYNVDIENTNMLFAPLNLDDYDLVFFGTFTWDYGMVPDEVKDYIADIQYKPNNMVIFGTGDTQFGGDDIYCNAVDKLVHFYKSKWEGLKIEQSPRGEQEIKVENWVKNIMKDNKVYYQDIA